MPLASLSGPDEDYVSASDSSDSRHPVRSATGFASAPTAPPLPAPSGRIVNVSTEPQLQQAFRSLTSDTTILIQPGTYRLTGTLHASGSLNNVTVRGATNNRDDVVLLGPGMTDASVPHGIWTGGGVVRITIANLTIRDFYNHCVILNGGTESPRLYNLRLLNAGQQIVKSNPDGAGGGVDDGVVEVLGYRILHDQPGLLHERRGRPRWPALDHSTQPISEHSCAVRTACGSCRLDVARHRGFPHRR